MVFQGFIHQLTQLLLTAGAPSCSSSVCGLAPHTVTVLSPEGPTTNFNSETTSQDTLKPESTSPPYPHSSGSDGTCSPPNDEQEAEVTSSNPEASELVATSNDQGMSEDNCAAKLERLSLSSGANTPSERLSTIPALFVFGGMDTQETVHGDAFVFVP